MNEQADGLFELQQNTFRTANWDPDSDLFKTGDEFLTGKSYEPPPSLTCITTLADEVGPSGIRRSCSNSRKSSPSPAGV